MFKKILPLILALACILSLAGCAALAAGPSDTDPVQGTKGLNFELSSDGEGYVCTGLGNATTTDIVIPATYKDKPVLAIENGAFYNCVTLTSVTVQEGVQMILPYAFRGCVRLETVVLPGSVSFLGTHAFAMCASLKTVTIADNDKTFEDPKDDVRLIGESAFKGCSSLTELRLPEEVTMLSRRVLDGCASLKEITIPVGVEALDEGCFAGCTSLTTIRYEGTKEQWEKLPRVTLWDLDVRDCTVVCSDGTLEPTH
jgi:hypothetical protein